MLVEGTQSAIKNVAVDVGVPKRSSSLSSSSTESPGTQHSGTHQGGETASNKAATFAGADEISLSTAADSVTGSLLAPEDGPNQAEEARQTNSNTETDNTQNAQGRDEERINQFTQEANQQLNESLTLRFTRDEETGTDVFQLVEEDTGDVVRQIPPDDVLDFMKKFEESVSGLLFSQQA